MRNCTNLNEDILTNFFKEIKLQKISPNPDMNFIA